MRTHRIGKVDIEEDKLAADLEAMSAFAFVEPYQEFVCGRASKSVMLRAPGGVSGDGVISRYSEDAESCSTEFGRQLPYVGQIMEQAFSLRHIRFARLAVLSSNVLVPHRDYVEFEAASAAMRPAHRLHIPLATNPSCLFSEDEVVYRMAAGEVWFLDVTRVHTAAALSSEVRVHLIVDFVDVDDESHLLAFDPADEQTIPLASIVHRPPLPDAERLALHSLASVLDVDNLQDVLGIVAKKHFSRDGGCDFFWRTVDEIGRQVGDPAMRSRLTDLKAHFLLDREV